jgi:hypothetical protein
VPLDTTLPTGSALLAVVPMGLLGDRLNTFWQLFSRPAGTTRWVLVTPPGVADNGGLVVSSGAGATLAGIEPSQDLSFSPVAASTDGGTSWSPGLLPAGLVAVPDAISTSVGDSLALVRTRGGEVLESRGDVSTWSTLVSRDTIASSTVGRSCGVGGLTAVALDSSGGALVGTTCASSGSVGIFGRVDGAWQLVGPRLEPRTTAARTTVARLVEVNGEIEGLVAVRDGSGTSLVGVARASGGTWTDSTALALRVGSRVASTGVTATGGFVVLLSGPARSQALEVESGPGGAWHALPAPPPGTATVAVGTGGEVDALVVAATVLTDWRLDAPTGTWSKIGTVTVPIQFGSSS